MKQGFTIVELMITLFVASLFIISGYQLYGVVVAANNEARAMSEASNIGYTVLREKSHYIAVSSPCTASSLPQEVVHRAVTTLPQPVTIRLTRCTPFVDTASVIRLMVTVEYGTPKKEVTHAVYVSS